VHVATLPDFLLYRTGIVTYLRDARACHQSAVERVMVQGHQRARQVSILEEAIRFDFASRLAHHPAKVASVLHRDPVGALSLVYLDVNTDICNHNCVFCDGFYRSLSAASIPTPRLIRLAEELVEIGVAAVVIAGDRGEPLIHPGLSDVLRIFAENSVNVGIYTNGSIIPDAIFDVVSTVSWIRVSADAATSATHQVMHGYPASKNDFEALLGNLQRLSAVVPDLGTSFILDPQNIREITPAADVLLEAGARFIEYKPKYLPNYTVDTDWLIQARTEIAAGISDAQSRWADRVVINNQLGRLLGQDDLPTLTRDHRICLTSLLRMVISTHGCYPCTPYRGEPERRFGNIMTQTVREALTSAERVALIDNPCDRVCTYDEQNDYLLRLDAGAANLPPVAGPPLPWDSFI
jgi:MoaA/NifB/PqqE/SkfB family radical SAM enzyme